MQVDALIIGAGPAGTSCALGLAKQGLRVVIIDKSIFPDKKHAAVLSVRKIMVMLNDLGIWPKF